MIKKVINGIIIVLSIILIGFVIFVSIIRNIVLNVSRNKEIKRSTREK